MSSGKSPRPNARSTARSSPRCRNTRRLPKRHKVLRPHPATNTCDSLLPRFRRYVSFATSQILFANTGVKPACSIPSDKPPHPARRSMNANLRLSVMPSQPPSSRIGKPLSATGYAPASHFLKVRSGNAARSDRHRFHRPRRHPPPLTF